MNNEPIVMERVYNAPVARVWKALTDRDQMKEWYFNIAEFKAEPGFEFSFEAGDPNATMYNHLCVVKDVVPERKLSYTWRYEGYEGDSLVTFELFPEGNSTRLKLTHEGLETFPPIASFAKKNFVMGWTDITGRTLKEYVEKEQNA
jgi:uncharacterized protein YndB with AHSA1/START domain